MEIGIGLPNTIEGTDRNSMLDWARSAESHGFSSLGTIGRIVYHTYEELVSLSAAAAVTERIRLTTSVLLTPLYSNAALLAKQAASLDALSNGRLVLGLGLGAREDDYAAAGVPMKGRGKQFDAMLETMKDIWSGKPQAGSRPIGPPPVRESGPEILIGGGSPATAVRVARYGNGFIAGGGGAAMFQTMMGSVSEEWAKAGRHGKPRTAALAYFSLGPDAKDAARGALGDYYAFLPDFVEYIIQGAATDDGMVRSYVDQFADAGCDELLFMPCAAGVEQVELLANATR